jgi:acetyl esterase/lipase
VFTDRVVDLTRSCDSWDSNSSFDIVPIPSNGDHLDPVACYLGSNMERYLTHPYASPLFGDFIGLPPLLIQAGESEVLRDEVTLLAHKATLAGVQVMHELYEDAVSFQASLAFVSLLMASLHNRFTYSKHFLSSKRHNTPSDPVAPL